MPDARGRQLDLYTVDGVRLDAVHLPADDADLAIVIAHGFSGSWRNARTRHIARALGGGVLGGAALGGRVGVVGFDFRGHGRSAGASTVGDQETFDLAAAVDYARRQGYQRVAVMGFSMGAAVAVRHAALHRGVDAVVSVSGPAHWYYRGTAPMRMLHHAVERPAGRLLSRMALRTRISSGGWPTPPPPTPEAVAHKISPAPLLVVHGDDDRFFPLRHAYALHEAAVAPKELWIERGMGHAESGMTPELARRLADWVSGAV
ncbi:MAG: alpha/beta hydrolase [Stackebrandtia sp.]